MSTSANLSYKLSSIYGRHTIPTSVPNAADCGGNHDQLVESYNANRTTDRISRLALEEDERNYLASLKEGPSTQEKMHSYFPITNKPDNVPFIYERDELNSQEIWQQARIETIETAYQTAGIYSLSFLPVDRQLEQTWFFKMSYYNDPGTKYVSRSNFSQTRIRDAVEHLKPNRDATALSGFMKPYSSYTSGEYLPDSSLNIRSAVILTSEQDLVDLPENIRQIGKHFLNDSQASAVAITSLQRGIFTQVKKTILTKAL